MMLPSQELKLIYDKQMRVTEEAVMNLFRDFIKVSPVDTGSFKAAWSIRKTDNDSWEITNDVLYASILFDGRRLVADKWYGSEQWLEKDSGHVMLEKFNRSLQRKLDRI